MSFLHRAIKCPFYTVWETRVIISLVAVFYLLAVILLLPNNIYMKYDNQTNMCIPSNVEAIMISSLIITILGTFIPMLCIMAIQFLSYKALQNSTTSTSIATNPTRIQQIQRANRTFAVVIVVFFAMTSPVGVVSVWIQYNAANNKDFLSDKRLLIAKISGISQMFLLGNSSANPLIYGQIHRKIWSILQRFLSNRTS